jgi:peptidoglycan hydrolase CwlO-like protein
LIHHTCFKCKRRFELDPVMVGFELNKLKKKNPKHYQAECPACRAINKVSVEQMQDELNSVSEEVEKLVAEYKQRKAEDKAAKQAKAREKASKSANQKKSKAKKAKV